ncbi:MAG: hypothetical protein RL885_15445 [Planctomycetota bacterium]
MLRLIQVFTAALTIGASALGHDETPDLRDRVVFKDSDRDVLQCRVIEPFGEDEITVVRDGKKDTIPRKQVAEMDLVNDRLIAWLARRDPRVDGAEANFVLAKDAEQAGLYEMAALQAMFVERLDPKHQEAKALLKRLQAKGYGLVRRGQIRSEHFLVRTELPLDYAVDVLLDLERFYVHWWQTWAPKIRAREIVAEPMVFDIAVSQKKLAPLSSDRIPYYDPGSGNGTSFTYLERGADRPERLFELATEQILYEQLPTKAGMGRDPRRGRQILHRKAAWLEIGFGHYLGSRFGGPAGYASAQAGTPLLTKRSYRGVYSGVTGRLDLGITERWDGLEDLIGWQFSQFHDQTKAHEFRWEASKAFVEFLLDPSTQVGPKSKQRPTAPILVEYLRRAFREAHTGSSNFDECLGYPIEALDRSFSNWTRGRAQ